MIEVENFTKKFTDDTVSNVIKIKRNFFKVSDELQKVRQQIKQEPFAIGTYLGSGKPFHPSVALLDWLGERTKRYVVIDRKSEWLFLCDRDVFAKSIIEKNADDGLAIIKNTQGEVLGLGKFTGRRVAIKNIIDKGDFLRRERH